MSKFIGLVCGAALAFLCASGANAQALPSAAKQMRLAFPSRRAARPTSSVACWRRSLASVPAKTPRAAVERLNAELGTVLAAAEVRSWLREQGLDPVADKPDQARQRLGEDIDRRQRIVKAAGIKPE